MGGGSLAEAVLTASVDEAGSDVGVAGCDTVADADWMVVWGADLAVCCDKAVRSYAELVWLGSGCWQVAWTEAWSLGVFSGSLKHAAGGMWSSLTCQEEHPSGDCSCHCLAS